MMGKRAGVINYGPYDKVHVDVNDNMCYFYIRKVSVSKL